MRGAGRSSNVVGGGGRVRARVCVGPMHGTLFGLMAWGAGMACALKACYSSFAARTSKALWKRVLSTCVVWWQ